jgi:hypothetical protein
MDEELKLLLFEGINYLLDSIERHTLQGDTGLKVAFDRFFGILKRKNQQYIHEESFLAFSKKILQLDPWVVAGRFADVLALIDTGRKVLSGGN